MTYCWASVYCNTNLSQIHSPKAKPPHIATPTKVIYISTTFYISTYHWKISLIWKLFPWFWLKTPCFSLTGKSFQNFPWSVGTLSILRMRSIIMRAFYIIRNCKDYKFYLPCSHWERCSCDPFLEQVFVWQLMKILLQLSHLTGKHHLLHYSYHDLYNTNQEKL